MKPSVLRQFLVFFRRYCWPLAAAITTPPDLASGVVRTRVTNPAFDVPTTITGNTRGLYVVNARFGIVVTPDTPYNVVRFDRP